MQLPINTPDRVIKMNLSHVALIEGFLTSVVGMTRFRSIGPHFDSGRDTIYRSDSGEVAVTLEYSGGH